MRRYLLFFVLLAVFTGCTNVEPAKPPQWILDPSYTGKVGAVGTANRHYKGLAYQRKLAITRALDELALQTGVSVSLRMQKKEHIENDKISSVMDTDSSYVSNKKQITAHIEAAWQDPKTEEFFVWLVKD